MGSRNRDRWPMEAWRHKAPTVGRMLEQRWDVIATCAQCGLQAVVDLRVPTAMLGPDAVLWNATTPCKRLGCPGTAKFLGRPPGLGKYMLLEAEWVDVTEVGKRRP